jgi:nucleotide-binding universal stress UspA family protein
MYKHIMLPIDGSELSDKAVKVAIAFAKAIGAKVSAIHVISHYHVVIEEGFSSKALRDIEKNHEEVSKKGARKVLDKVEKIAKAEGVKCEGVVVVGDQPYQEIIDKAAARKCDLIVMASHGRRGLEGLVLGSETIKVLTHSKIPVLVVR